MQTFNWRFEAVDSTASILHDVATPFAYIIAPVIGVKAWQLAAASITGFIAKENVVGTLAVCYGISNLIDLESLEMIGSSNEVASALGLSSVAALAFLMFNLFTPPCFAAIGAMRSEIQSRKWFWSGIGLQFAVGYSISFLVFFFGTLFVGGDFGSVWMPIVGWIALLFFSSILIWLIVRRNKAMRSLTDKNLKETVGV